MRMRKKLAILAIAVVSAIPAASLADPNKECPGGPPGHCKSGQGRGQSQEQEQEQNQDQSQSQCLISIGILGDANCEPTQ